MQKIKFNKIGMRSIKTAISATLCAVLYAFLDRNATFACIGAVFGMESDTIKHPWVTGGNRIIGTIIGGLLGVLMYAVHLQYDNQLFQTVLLFVGIIALIYINQLLGTPGAIQGGSVVFYIIMLNMPEHQYVTYALNRMLDTAFGVGVSVAINVIHKKYEAKYQK